MAPAMTIAQFTERYRLGNPFSLDNDKAYQAWRDIKLEDYPDKLEQLIVAVNDPADLTRAEFNAVHALVVKTNMAIYAGNTGIDPDRKIPSKLGKRFGLTALDDNMGADDGVTSLKVVTGQWRGGYIPYTNKPIHWHTDGYYNPPDLQIRGLLLHCVRPAAQGGENALLDHELAYIHLRDINPDYIEALMASDAMTIPANIDKGKEIRPERTGPVFSVMADGNLHMRYTARTRSIKWSEDARTRAAVKALAEFLESESPWIFRATLESGQGLVSNNVLHDRSGFEDDKARKRLLYRLRYYQRVAGS
ncbi:MAG: TauD/TfdA family dioxygenase [Thiotrichales bacterium]|nr:MAG: TauD/TfdA family dioxygenase [Thiotrichales bacterium]